FYAGGLASGYHLTQLGSTNGFYQGGMGSGYASTEMIQEILATIDQQGTAEKINMYPNPASETIYFESKGDVSYIEIFNTKGLRMIEQEVPIGKNVIQLPVYQLSKGVHLVIIHKTTGEVFYKKLIKQ
ncbi:MAG: T9SS type A sorting domain-containing protein, partial [Bacteroidota bacterium]